MFRKSYVVPVIIVAVSFFCTTGFVLAAIKRCSVCKTSTTATYCQGGTACSVQNPVRPAMFVTGTWSTTQYTRECKRAVTLSSCNTKANRYTCVCVSWSGATAWQFFDGC